MNLNKINKIYKETVKRYQHGWKQILLGVIALVIALISIGLVTLFLGWFMYAVFDLDVASHYNCATTVAGCFLSGGRFTIVLAIVLLVPAFTLAFIKRYPVITISTIFGLIMYLIMPSYFTYLFERFITPIAVCQAGQSDKCYGMGILIETIWLFICAIMALCVNKQTDNISDDTVSSVSVQ